MAKKATEKTTAIATATAANKGELISAENYALISDVEALEAMIYNLQGETISEFDLDRVKVPAGGATVFQVPTLEGIENAETIEGIILHIGQRRSYWSDSNPTGSPPDCYSIDGLRGIGNPGGDCASCPFNQFGSAIDGAGKQRKGKRCREMRLMLIIRPEDRLPMVVMAPPTSIKGLKQWLLKLPVFMFQAVVRLSLERDKNNDGIAYSKIVPSYVGRISMSHAKALQAYAETLKKVISGKAPLTNDFDNAGERETAPSDDGNTIEGEVVAKGPGGGDGAERLPDDE